jgi:hypothetical protein
MPVWRPARAMVRSRQGTRLSLRRSWLAIVTTKGRCPAHPPSKVDLTLLWRGSENSSAPICRPRSSRVSRRRRCRTGGRHRLGRLSAGRDPTAHAAMESASATRGSSSSRRVPASRALSPNHVTTTGRKQPGPATGRLLRQKPGRPLEGCHRPVRSWGQTRSTTSQPPSSGSRSGGSAALWPGSACGVLFYVAVEDVAATVVEAVTVDATVVRRVQHAAGTSFRGAR